MTWFNFLKRKKRINTHSIDPDEIFLDTLNISGFDTQQMEGVIERSISQKALYIFGGIIGIIGIIFVIQLIRLQVISGATYFNRSENNRLHHTPLFADRGVIYDRNQVELAWNITSTDGKPFSVREYIQKGGFAHLIGYVGYPTKDTAGFFWRDTIIGKSGIEKKLNDILSGTNGQKIVEVNAYQEILSENLVTPPIVGSNVSLTIDSGVQAALYEGIQNLATSSGFEGGAGIIMDVHTGEIIALTSYPEFDLNILSHGSDRTTISSYATDVRRVYLNRAVAGLYTPGSIVKPYIAIGALQEKIITPQTTVLSTGSVEIPNRYDPTKPQVFRDWKKEGHGITNVFTAIAESVNTFFYAIGGGYKNQQALGIDRMNIYFKKFGLDTKTGIDIDGEVVGTIPSQPWKEKTFPADPTWRQGDTYNSAIGQFGFQVTVVEMVRAVAAIANRGTLVTPFVIAARPASERPTETVVGVDAQWFQLMNEAMRETVLRGTAQSVNLPYVTAAVKTGTAQVGPRNAFMNSWSTGFFPYDNPRYAFAVVMDKAASTNQTGATFVMRHVFEWMHLNDQSYFK